MAQVVQADLGQAGPAPGRVPVVEDLLVREAGLRVGEEVSRLVARGQLFEQLRWTGRARALRRGGGRGLKLRARPRPREIRADLECLRETPFREQAGKGGVNLLSKTTTNLELWFAA